MSPGITLPTVVWLGCGLAILAVGGLVRSRGRVGQVRTEVVNEKG